MTATQTLQAMIQKAADLRRAGRWHEAEHAYKVVLSNEPNLPDCWYNLALIQRQIGRFESSLACYGEALKLGVRNPEEVHLNRAVLLADFLRRPTEAEQELNTALRARPAYFPALLNLANLKEEQGDRDGALAVYDRILAVTPTHGEALARSARLRSVQTPDDKLVTRLRSTVADPAKSAADKASVGFTLGKLLDECGAYDQAFEAYAAANRHSRQSVQPPAFYDRAAHERAVDRLIEVFSVERASFAAAPASNPPIFICGMFRSGSTLVEQVLASHPKVTAGGELEFLSILVRSDHLHPFPDTMERVSREKLAELAEWYRTYTARLFPGAIRTTDKRPDNFLRIGLIKSLFPNARIINTVRNPLDTCLSIFFTHLDHGEAYALDLADTAHYYNQYLRLMAHWRSLYGADILDFDYDALVQDPKPSVERLLAFCGLEWDDACLSFHRAKNLVKTASVWQVREPLYRRASGRWRHYERHIEPLRRELAERAV